MELIDRFKEAMNNVYLFKDKDPEDVKYVLREDVERMTQQILLENENRISDYDINNFDKDFADIVLNFVDILEDPNFKLSTKFNSSCISSNPNSPSIFLMNLRYVMIDVYHIMKNEYYLVPFINETYNKSIEIEESKIHATVNLVKNSFPELLMNKLKDFGFVILVDQNNIFEDFNVYALRTPKLRLAYDLENNLKNSLALQINLK